MAVLTQRQISLIRTSVHRIPYDGNFDFYLYQLLVALPLYMGIRQNELRGLTLDDVDLGADYLVVNGRSIPFHPEMKKLVRRYISYRAARVKSDFHFFLVAPTGSVRYKITPTRLATYYDILSDISRVVFTCNDLRETYIYKVIASGAPPIAVMALTGISYRTAENYFRLASRTINVDNWYTQSVEPKYQDKRKP